MNLKSCNCIPHTENVVPLLNKILEMLGHQSLAGVVEALNYLYKILKEDCPEFVDAASTAIKKGATIGIEVLLTVIKTAVDLCKRNKELMTHLTKLATKALAREGATVGTKALMKYGAKKLLHKVPRQLLSIPTQQAL